MPDFYRPTHIFNFLNIYTKMTLKEEEEATMQAALKLLRSQEKPNVAQVARNHMLNESTLRRRYNGTTTSWAEYQSERNQKLNITQEQVLIDTINKFTNRGIPPTSRMVKNFAEEICGTTVHKNWVGDFVKRHKNVLKSVYLRNIDNLRRKAEYAPMFAHFYELV
jgi:NAD-dependent SIR2 family protein deacetylase